MQLFTDGLAAGHEIADVLATGSSALAVTAVKTSGRVFGPLASFVDGRVAGQTDIESLSRAVITEGAGAIVGAVVVFSCTGVTAGFGVAACVGGGAVIRMVVSEVIGDELDKMVRRRRAIGGAASGVSSLPPATRTWNRPPAAIGGSASARAANRCAFDFHKVGMSQLSCYDPPSQQHQQVAPYPPRYERCVDDPNGASCLQSIR